MKRVNHTISDGDRGIDQTVQHMWRLIKRDVSDDLIVKKARSFKADSAEQTVKNTFDYVVSRFKYKNDPPGVELVTAPVHMVSGKRPYGDCDDLVTVLCCLLAANKIPVRIKTIAWRRHEYTHVIAEVFYKGSWHPMDPVKGSSGFNNQIKIVIREQIYEDPKMSRPLVTLEDGPSCCGGKSKRRGDNENNNNNIILIGNTSGSDSNPRYIPDNRQQPAAAVKQSVPEQTKIIEKEKRVPVPFPVEKKVYLKTPFRVIANRPVTVYKEFY